MTEKIKSYVMLPELLRISKYIWGIIYLIFNFYIKCFVKAAYQ